jgi:hypothetical protein
MSNEQVITQAIKALRVGHLHNYLLQGRPQTLEELYDNFCKFSKSKVLHFHKLERQRKVPKENKASRPTKYSRGRESTMSFDNTTKQVHNIDSDGYNPRKSRRKTSGLCNLKIEIGPPTPEKSITTQEAVILPGARPWTMARQIVILYVSRKRYIP